MKAEKDKICECKKVVGPVVDEINGIVERTKQVTIQEESEVGVRRSENDLNDMNPVIFKSFSGDLKIALNQKIVEEINKNLQEGTNVYVALRKTDNGKLVFSLHSDALISPDDKVFLPKKSLSGNIILEAYKPIHQKSFNSLNKELQNKTDEETKNDASNGVNFYGPSHHNMMLQKINTNTIKGHTSTCEESCGIYKVKIKGVNCTTPMYGLKQTTSGNFQIVLDKEYERYHKQAIKEYEGDNNVEYVQLQKSESGHFIINFEEDHRKNKKDALIIRTQSGSIKVLVNKSKMDSVSNIRDSNISKSIMTANDVNELLNKSVSKEIYSKDSKKFELPLIKSNSDSNLYKKEKSNISNENRKKSHKDHLKDKYFESKAIATSCNARCHDSSCDKSKCICKNICYKSKQWFWENSDRETHKCGISNVKKIEKSFQSFNANELTWCKRRDNVQVLKKPTNVPKNPCGCCLVLEKMSKEHYFSSLIDSCPYDINKYESISSEFLEISAKYNKQHIDRLETYNKNDTLESENKDKYKIFHWDSLEYFPPQLPPFLRDFTYL